MIIIFKLLDRMAYGMFLLGVLSGIVMTFTVFVSTLMRYLFNSPVHFSNELAGLLFFSITFLTIPHVLNINRHINIDMVVRNLPAKMNRAVGILSGAVVLLFSAIFVYESWGFVSFSRAIGSRSDISSILLWPWMLLMPLCFVMCILIRIKHAFIPPRAAGGDDDMSVEAL